MPPQAVAEGEVVRHRIHQIQMNLSRREAIPTLAMMTNRVREAMTTVRMRRLMETIKILQMEMEVTAITSLQLVMEMTCRQSVMVLIKGRRFVRIRQPLRTRPSVPHLKPAA